MMETPTKTIIEIETAVNAPIQKVWQMWISEHAITKWNTASPDWHTTSAVIDLKPGGKFCYRMEAKDGSFGFDFSGVFNEVIPASYLDITLDDSRKMTVTFTAKGNTTHIAESFEAEDQNPHEMQRTGWQNILDNFRHYMENLHEQIGLHYEIKIDAAAQKVYETMIDQEKYRLWTTAFCPVSYYEGNWDKDSKISFIGEDHNGEKGGMIAKVAENIPAKFISLQYLGVLKGDQEVNTGEEVDVWKGSFENYTFKEEESATLLSIDLTGTKELEEFFNNAWPAALNILKDLSEN
jgi:uncharacterized protein YndB with AHSA1/START domain